MNAVGWGLVVWIPFVLFRGLFIAVSCVVCYLGLLDLVPVFGVVLFWSFGGCNDVDCVDLFSLIFLSWGLDVVGLWMGVLCCVLSWYGLVLVVFWA